MARGKNIFRTLLYGVILAIFIGAALLGFTQTKLFRSYLRVFLLTEFSKVTYGSLYLGEFHGSIFTGLTIDGVALQINGTYLFSAERVRLRYDPISLIERRITFHEIILTEPRVRLVRFADSTWNYEHLFLPKEQKQRKGLPWTFAVRNFQIQGGIITVVDSTTPISDTSSDVLHYTNFVARDISLALVGLIGPKEARAQIEHAALHVDSPPITVHNIIGTVIASTKGVVVDNLRIDLEQSHLQVMARLDGLNLFGGSIQLASLRTKSATFNIEAAPLDSRELRKFIAPLWFMDQQVYLHAQATGTFGSMVVHDLTLRADSTEIALRGSVDHLDEPANLFLTVESTRALITYGDVMELLPGLKLPDFSHLGQIDATLQFVGKPVDFAAKAILKTRFGTIDAKLALNAAAPTLRYNGSMTMRNVNLELLPSSRLRSKLNGIVTIRGSGTSLRQAIAQSMVQLDTSSLGDIQIKTAIARMSAASGSAQVNLQVNTSVGAGNIAFATALSSPQSTRLSYMIDGAFSSINLGKLLHNPFYESSLNFTLHGAWSGSSIEEFTGSASIQLESARGGLLRARPVEAIPLHLAVTRSTDGKRQINIESSVADLSIGGRFTYSGLLSSLTKIASHISDEIVRRSGGSGGVEERHRRSTVPTSVRVDTTFEFAHYNVQLKNISPIAAFFSQDEIDGTGSLVGSVTRKGSHVWLRDSLWVDYFARVSSKGALYFRNAEVVIDLHDDTFASLADSLALVVAARMEKNFLNEHEFRGLKFDFAVSDRYGELKSSVLFDSALFVKLTSAVDLRDSISRIIIDTLFVDYREHPWHLTSPAILLAMPHSLSMAEMVFAGSSGEVRLSDVAIISGALSGKLQAMGLRLRELLSMFMDTTRYHRVNGGMNLMATFSGTFSAPELQAMLTLDSVSYGGAAVGNFAGDVKLREGYLSGSFALRSPPSAELSIHPQRTVPLRVRGTFPLRSEDDTLDVEILASSFPLETLAPLVSVADNLTGNLTGTLLIRGTPKSPLFSGSLEADASLLFLLNGLKYTVHLSVTPAGDRLVVDSLVVLNERSEAPEGRFVATGEVFMHGFQVNSFSTAGIGELLIMKKSVSTSQEISGTLYLTTGSDSLRLTGTTEEATLRGVVKVKEASIVFPPSPAASEAAMAEEINYVYLATTRMETPQERLERLIEERRKRSREQMLASHFLPRFSYDLTIETLGRTEVRFLINPITDEELFAVLNGKLHLFNERDMVKLVGDIAIGERSYYYNFYKKFAATGKLRFTGDPVNPELDVTATYSGTHAHADTVEQVAVVLHITGTLTKPDVAMNMTINGKSPPPGRDVQADAISYIISGKFKDELLGPEGTQLSSDVGTTLSRSVISGVSTSLLSNALSKFLRETGFIQSLELSYGGGGVSSTGVRLSGEIGSAYWRYEGKVFSDITNADIVVQFSLGEVFHSARGGLRSLVLELARRSKQSFEAPEEKQGIYEARIYYRITF
ncbi:MAG: translocation/assembly module TamB domain-containing protein [Bacteroidota bacterium]